MHVPGKNAFRLIIIVGDTFPSYKTRQEPIVLYPMYIIDYNMEATKGGRNQTTADVGQFIPTSELIQWHTNMQGRFPQIFTKDDKLFGTNSNDQQHILGTRLRAYFDNDTNKPRICEILGSQWKLKYIDRQPVYLIRIDGGLSQIALTSAHDEEGGWQVVS